MGSVMAIKGLFDNSKCVKDQTDLMDSWQMERL